MSSHMTRRAVKQAKSHPSDSGNESDDQNDTERQSLYTNEEISSAQTLVSLMDNENGDQNAETSAEDTSGQKASTSGTFQANKPLVTGVKSVLEPSAAPVKSLFGPRPQTNQLPTSRQSGMFGPPNAMVSHSSQFPTHNQFPTAGQPSMFASQSMFSYPSASSSSAYPYGLSMTNPYFSGTPGYGYYQIDPSTGFGPMYGPYAGHSGYGPMSAIPSIPPMPAATDCHQCPYCLATSAAIQPKNN